MEFLFILIIGFVILYWVYSSIKEAIMRPRKKLEWEVINLKKQIEVKEKRINSLEHGMKLKDDLATSIQNRDTEAITLITSLYSDYLLVQYNISARYLEIKERPAYKEAERIRELKAETKQYIEAHRQMKYKYELLVQLFPELNTYIDDFGSIFHTRALTVE